MKYFLSMALLVTASMVGMEKTLDVQTIKNLDCKDLPRLELFKEQLAGYPLDIQNIIKKMLLRGEDGPFLRGIETLRPVAELIGVKRKGPRFRSIAAVAIQPDGKLALTAYSDMTVRIWDLTNKPTEVAELPQNVISIASIAMTPDGKWVILQADGALLWDFTDPKKPVQVAKFGEGDMLTVGITDDASRAITGHTTNVAKLWDLTDRTKPLWLADLKGHSDWVAVAVITPDGRWALTGSRDKTAKLWDLSNPKEPMMVANLPGHTHWVYGAAISPDGTLAITGSSKEAKVWDLTNPKNPVMAFQIQGDAEFVGITPDRMAIIGRGDKAGLWDLSNPRKPVPLIALPEAQGTAALSSNGNWLILSDGKEAARVWDLRYPLSLWEVSLALITRKCKGKLNEAFEDFLITEFAASKHSAFKQWGLQQLSGPKKA